LLEDWDGAMGRFAKVMPRDYKKVLAAAKAAEDAGQDVDEAIMAASRG
jgi:glutamate synthase (NADPH/NADH) large chain